jgi:CDP-diacylglycerol---glycerol-3-phosphate 3-phosphatidyltransferase
MAATNIPKGAQDRLLKLTRPVVGPLVRAGVHPNVVTTFGFLVTVGGAVSFMNGQVRLGGLLVLLGGLIDIFDGAVARQSGLASAFGSFYDSTLDRISEILLFVGILGLYGGANPTFGQPWMIYVVGLVLGGSLMVSYTRATAEKLGLDCQVGMMQRLERLLLLGSVSLVFGAAWNGAVFTGLLIVMAVLTNLTAVQRIVWVYKQTRPPPREPRMARARSTELTGKPF